MDAKPLLTEEQQQLWNAIKRDYQEFDHGVYFHTADSEMFAMYGAGKVRASLLNALEKAGLIEFTESLEDLHKSGNAEYERRFRLTDAGKADLTLPEIGCCNPDVPAESPDSEDDVPPNTCTLSSAIACAARLPMDAAVFLAEYALSGNYAGGPLHIGVGEYGYDTALFAIIYPVLDRWYIAAGYRLPDGRFRLVDAARAHEAQTHRWYFHFERRCDTFTEFTPGPAGDPDTSPALPDTEPVLPVVPPAHPEDEPGTVYILMLDEPLGSQYHRAQFYTGWAKYLSARLDHHRAGRGSHFTRAAVERGIGFKLVFAIPGTRADERRIKNRKNVRRFLQAQGVAV